MRWIQLFLVTAFLFAGVSLFIFSTAHPALWPALIVLAFNVVSTTLSVATGLSRRRIDWSSHQKLVCAWSPAEGRYPSIDVFLPTSGESLAILRNTYEHVAALQWPGQLRRYVLDDSARDGVALLAAEYGFEYVVRPDRGHLRKAGNLRHAYSMSSGDLIAIFDADFTVRHDFLAHLVPYLDDDQVAIVQSPQTFATTESMNWIQRTAGATQEYFYRWVLPSRDKVGAANCVGTSAVYRRSALDRVGGFAEIEHSEDLHTGKHVQHAGYRVDYVPVVLSRGLCPVDLAAFLNQQYRWCMGSLSRLPNRHLAGIGHRATIRQRLASWAGVFYYLTTAMNVFMVFVPGIVMAAFFPDDVRPAQLVPFLLGLWVYVVLFPLVSRSRWRFEVLRIQMAYSFAHTVAIWHKLIGREVGWVPTSVVGKTNSLARSISVLGLLALGGSLAAFWVVIIRDLTVYGLWNFFMMVGFVLAYTYLAAPLVIEFGRVLLTRRDRREQQAAEPDPDLDVRAAIDSGTGGDSG
ncbi:MAG: cellulose synthase catalytic subunit, partial [Gordonia sp. (in: high G+C Gram-positive bacteria)]